jgi:hypothetical protein
MLLFLSFQARSSLSLVVFGGLKVLCSFFVMLVSGAFFLLFRSSVLLVAGPGGAMGGGHEGVRCSG